MMEIMKIMVTSFRRSHAGTATLSAPSPAAGHCQPTPVFLPGESQGWGSLLGCRLWGRMESDTTEAT